MLRRAQCMLPLQHAGSSRALLSTLTRPLLHSGAGEGSDRHHQQQQETAEQPQTSAASNTSSPTHASPPKAPSLAPPKTLLEYASLKSNEIVGLVKQEITTLFTPPRIDPNPLRPQPLFSPSTAPLGATQTVTPAPVFAVVYIAGQQFKVSINDVVVTNKLDCKVGSKIVLEKVLLVGGMDFTFVGTPLVSNKLVRVEATVIEQSKSAKVIVFKKKRRKQYKKWKGHRQDITTLRINTVKLLPAALEHSPSASATALS